MKNDLIALNFNQENEDKGDKYRDKKKFIFKNSINIEIILLSYDLWIFCNLFFYTSKYDCDTLIKMMKNLLNLKNATLWNRIRYNTRSLATRLSIRVYFIYFLNEKYSPSPYRVQILINHPQPSREQSLLRYVCVHDER